MIEGKETSLELKLKKISNFVENFAYGVILIAVITRSIFRFCMSSFAEGDLFTTQTLTYGAKIAIMAIVLLIVCIPEGLALAAQIAMALMIGELKKDKILIKNPDAIQKAATITDICVSKTGVLTKGNGAVTKYHVMDEGDIMDNNPALNQGFKSADFSRKEEIIECILMNNDVTFQAEEPNKEDKDPEYTYTPRGPAIEVAAINFLNGCDNQPDERLRKDVHEQLDDLRAQKVRLFTFPFDQKLKRKMTVYALSEEEARVVVKGSPESISTVTGYDLKDISI
jgi:magnesium-transporting ATPase (P-type)